MNDKQKDLNESDLIDWVDNVVSLGWKEMKRDGKIEKLGGVWIFYFFLLFKTKLHSHWLIRSICSKNIYI